MSWPRQRTYRSDRVEEECESMTASRIARLLLEEKSSEDLCLLCLCGESLLGVEDSVYIGNEHIDTTISIKTLLEMLCIIPTKYANQKEMFQKVCATCVNQLSQFYMFIFKCQKNIYAFKEIELHVLRDTKALQYKRPTDIEIPSDNVNDYAIDFKFVGLPGTAPDEDVKFNVKTEPFEILSIEIEKIENVMSNDDVQGIATNELTNSCNICDVHFKSADKLLQHMRHHQYNNVISHISQCTPICICCLKTDQTLRCLSNKICISEISNDHGGLSKQEEIPAVMIKNIFNVTIGETSDSVLICDACIDHVIKAFKFYNALKESLSSFKAIVQIFEESLNNVICNSDEVHRGNIHIDLNKLKVQRSDRKGDKNKNNSNSLFVCEHCSRTFISKIGIKSHLRCNHRNILNEKHEWACTVCAKGFATKEELEIHKNVHSEDYTTCEYCRNIFLQTKLFVRHVSSCMKKKKPYKCDLCDATFVTRQSKYNHRKKHFPKKKCPLCSKWCESVSFGRHMIKHVALKQLNTEELGALGISITQKQPKFKRNIDKCPICHEVSQTYSHLKTHTAEELEEFNIKLNEADTVACEHCGKTISKITMSRHIKRAHPSKLKERKKTVSCVKSFQCDQCDYRSKDRFGLEGHMNKLHLNRRPYSCDICGKRFHNKNLRTEHVKKHNSKSELCSHCGDSFSSKTQLDRHVRRHGKESGKIKGTLQCDRCDYNTDERDQFECHVNKYHLNLRPYSCDICSKSFYTKKTCARHKIAHSLVKSEICPHCGKILRSAKAFKRHIVQHGIEKPAKKLQCDNCDYSTHAKDLLEGHVNKQHLNRRPYSCDVCSKSFHSKKACATHKEIHARKKSLMCPHCGKLLSSTRIFKKHVAEQHGGDKSTRKYLLQCDNCDYKTNTKANMEGHSNRHHLKIRPYPCRLCGKGFYTTHKCAIHEQTHAQLKPEVCPHCGNRFGSKKALVSHVRLHTGEKPYKCNKCDEGYVNASRLQHHILTKHTDKDTPCPLCSKLYHRVLLRNHIRKCAGRESGVKKAKKKLSV